MRTLASRKPAAGTGKGGAPYEVSTEWGVVREGAATPSAPAATSQSSVGTKVTFRESAACRTAVSLVVMRSRPIGSAPLFVPGGKSSAGPSWHGLARGGTGGGSTARAARQHFPGVHVRLQQRLFKLPAPLLSLVQPTLRRSSSMSRGLNNGEWRPQIHTLNA